MIVGIGGKNNPITIDDDDDTPDMATRLEQQRNRQILDEALITNSPYQICFAVVKTAILGSLQTKELKLNKAILEHYQQRIGIKISHEYFHPRPDIDYGDNNSEVEPTLFLLYGCDFLTTNSLKARFNMFGVNVSSVSWINESSCKVGFRDQNEASSVFRKMVPHIKMQDEGNELPTGWFQIKPYYVHVFERKLWIRYASSQDKERKKESTEKDKQFQEAYRELPKMLLIKFRAQEKYRQVILQIKRENERKRAMRLKNSMDRRNSGWEGRDRSRENHRRGNAHHQRFHDDERRMDQRQQRFNRPFKRGSRVYDQNTSLNLSHRRGFAQEDDDLSLILEQPKDKHQLDQNQSFSFNRPQPIQSQLNKNSTSFSKIHYDSMDREMGQCDSQLSFNMPPISERGKNSYEEGSVILGQGRKSPTHSHADFFLDEEDISRSLVIEKGKAQQMMNCSFTVNWQRPNNAVRGQKMAAEEDKDEENLSYIIESKTVKNQRDDLDPDSFSY